ncbi:tetratricopeptide repeat protein [Hymenobacter baengnokdamensis]|uniref:hypothetical protein n=1 Tax=Hymenobacter baengnokdamensis TaxID=2615203 RepID=UPI001244D64A|nr:hypothetical protein [Hymenobacter baengnokdamensis]
MEKILLGLLGFVPLIVNAQKSDTTYYRLAITTEKLATSESDLVKAVAYYTQAISMCKENSAELHFSYANRGQLKIQLGDRQSGIADLVKSISIKVVTSKIYWSKDIEYFTNEMNAISYYQIGLAESELGMGQESCIAFSRSGELGYAGAYEAIRKYCK